MFLAANCLHISYRNRQVRTPPPTKKEKYVSLVSLANYQTMDISQKD